MSLMRRPLLLLGGIVAVVVLAGATVWVTHDTTSTMRPEEARTAAPAGAKLRTCAKSVLADWYDDGRVSKLYPVACYTAALTMLPTDIRHFSTASKDIQRALDLARKGKIAGASPSLLAQQAATRTFREWSTALKRGVREQPKRVFVNPPFPVLRQRLRDAARAYGFRIERIYIRWPRQQAPFIVVRTSDPTRFAHDLPAFLRNLNPNGDDRTGWAYEGFYLQALDATGQPFLIVFNNWRGSHPGGGQWASDPKLLPFAHG